MANQITIDIVAETKKLTSGIDEANKELGGMSKSLKTATKAAVGLASAFVLKQGVSFLKDGIEEAKDARKAMNDATTAFGAGSKALEKITSDAEKFGKALAVDNDDIIKLSTSLGSRLPKDAKELSAELVNLAFDVEAFTAGAVSADAVTNKLAKAFADGEISAKELAKIVPGLNKSVYEQAEALSKAGKNQEALNLVIKAGAAEYGDAAEKNVTASQKFNVAIANLKEEIGTKFLPILEKGVEFLVKLLNAFSALPAPVQNVLIGLTAIVGIGGPLIGVLASLKTSLEVLGVAKIFATTQTNLFSLALKGIPILAAIALIALLITNWDDVSKAAKEVWEKVSKYFGDIYEDIKKFVGDAIDWLKENWPKILAVLTGPFGLFVKWLVDNKDDILQKAKDIYNTVKDWLGENWSKILAILTGPFGLLITFFVTYKDEIVAKISEIWEAVKTKTVEWLDKIVAAVIEVWTAVSDFVLGAVELIRDGIVTKWNTIVADVQKVFDALKKSVKVIWDKIVEGAGEFVTKVIEKFKDVFGLMIQVGKDIANGVWQGLNSMKSFLKNKFNEFFGDLLPGWAKLALKISSPSKVFVEVGQNIVKGLASGITSGVNVTSPRLFAGSSSSGLGAVNITINAGAGTDPYSVGRAVTSAIDKYSRISPDAGRRVTL